MISTHKVKKDLEKIHLEYICRNFKLQNNIIYHEKRAYPDLYNLGKPKFLFELKSRAFPREQKGKRIRPITCFGWWHLSYSQIKRYEELGKAKGLELFWIFMLSQTKVEPTLMDKITENSIIKRDFYIVSWDAYKLIKPAPGKEGYIGLARLKRNYDFSESEIKKGKLYLPKNIEKKVGLCFL